MRQSPVHKEQGGEDVTSYIPSKGEEVRLDLFSFGIVIVFTQPQIAISFQ